MRKFAISAACFIIDVALISLGLALIIGGFEARSLAGATAIIFGCALIKVGSR